MGVHCVPNIYPIGHVFSLYACLAASASHMWDTIRALLPPTGRDNVGTFSRIQKFVDEHQLMTAICIPICPCGETIYYDFEDHTIRAMFPFCSTKRKMCQLCGQTKLVWDKDGNSKVRRSIYYLPYRYNTKECPILPNCEFQIEPNLHAQ